MDYSAVNFRTGDMVRIMRAYPRTSPSYGYCWSDDKYRGRKGRLVEIDSSNRPYLVEFPDDDDDAWSVSERTQTMWCAEVEPAMDEVWINGKPLRPHHFYRWMYSRIKNYARGEKKNEVANEDIGIGM